MRESTEILEIAEAIYQEFSELREDAQNRYDLYTRRREPTLPEDIAREGQVNVISALPVYAAQTVRADLLMNPTEFLVTPLAREPGGAIPRADSKKADNLERSMAIIWNQLNEGRRVDSEIIWHQLMSPFGVMVLECSELDYPESDEDTDRYLRKVERYRRERKLWHVSTPDPMTCAFLTKDGRPTIFIRKYKMLVRDVEHMYSKRRGFFQDRLLSLSDLGQWDWLSDDYEHTQFRRGSDEIQEVEMVWFDDGEWIYHLAKNIGSEDTGEVVWMGPNPLGRVSAFLVTGATSPLRDVEDTYEPFLIPLLQTVETINNIRTQRATASRNKAGPDNYIALDPETIKLYEQAGKKLPTEHKWKKGALPYLLGEIKEPPSAVDLDLDKLEGRLQEDLQRFLPSPFVHIVDPAILKSATATSILHAAESSIRMYGPLMSSYDTGIKELMGALIHSVDTVYGDETIYLYATGDEMARGVNLKEGEERVLSKDAVDFSFQISVKTRSMTQAQASAQYDAALKQYILPDGSRGPIAFEDLIDAANYTDKEAQMEKLASERILNAIDPWIQQMALGRAVAEIEWEMGITLPIGGAPPGGEGGPPGPGGGPNNAPSRLPNSAQRMDSPMISPMEGGTESVG